MKLKTYLGTGSVRRYWRKPFTVKVWLGTAGFIPQGQAVTAGYSGYYWRTVLFGPGAWPVVRHDANCEEDRFHIEPRTDLKSAI
jgi:hypothetical protein